jgi:hypothetical protein
VTRARVFGVAEEKERNEREEQGSSEQEAGTPSDVDAMGQDKRRQVVGHSYGPSKQRQLAYYGIFLAFVVVAYIGFRIAVSELDAAPKDNPDKAPWSQGTAPNDQTGREFFSPESDKGVVGFQ